MTTADIVNMFVRARAYTSCLEVFYHGHSHLDGVNCARRIRVTPSADGGGVAPAFIESGSEKFDVVIVDVHRCDATLQYIERALSSLRPGGIVVLRNCLPTCERMAGPEPDGGKWCGDVYQAAVWYFSGSPHLCYTADEEYGCGIIDTALPSESQPGTVHTRPEDLTYAEFDKDRCRLLNVVDRSAIYDLAYRGSGRMDECGTVSVVYVCAEDGGLVARFGLIPRPPGLSDGELARHALRHVKSDSGLHDVAIGVDAMPLVTVDQVVECSGVRPPELLIIDAGRYGVPVLYGALATMRDKKPALLFSAVPAGRGGDHGYDVVEHFMQFVDVLAFLGYGVVDRIPGNFSLLRYTGGGRNA